MDSATQRTIAEERLANESCGGCHSKFEPLAFGLERFDGIGRYHVVDEHDNALRQDGNLLIPGQAEPTSFQTPEELMQLLANSDRVRESITWKLCQFALGRPLTSADAATVREIHQQAKADGGTYQATLRALVRSDLVTLTPTE